MITRQTQLDVEGIRASEIIDFLLNCTDQTYQQWWTGTHLKFHTPEHHPTNIGNVVYIDEFVGKRKIKMTGVTRKSLGNLKKVFNIQQ